MRNKNNIKNGRCESNCHVLRTCHANKLLDQKKKKKWAWNLAILELI